jgi:succinate-acetate transporter protein
MVPNVLVGVLIFFGGICQFLAGIMEFISGNTVGILQIDDEDGTALISFLQFGATVFPSYGAFNLSYAMIYLPGSGIIAAYTDKTTGALSPEFNQALAMYVWAWFILTVIFTIAAVRSSWVLFLDLFFLDIVLILLAAGFMMGSSSVLTAAYSFGFIVAFLSCKFEHPVPQTRLEWPQAKLCNRLGRLRGTLGRRYNSHQPSHLQHVQGRVGMACFGFSRV